jgi:transcriptional regulator with XRE-family HTH domain
MKQPELGKKIADLRKSKGYTQEELVAKCNLSVRTLQRIESGEVSPRSYTIRIIFSALEFNFFDSEETAPNRIIKAAIRISNWPGHIRIYLTDLFNLKTNTMKKLMILSIPVIVLSLILVSISTESSAQKLEKVTHTIDNLTRQGNAWMNEGKIDSVLTLYREDATIIPLYHGKSEIRGMLESALLCGYELLKFETLSVSVADSIAVQTYSDVFLYNGITIRQEGMTEWRLTDGKWLVVNDIMVNY